MKSSKPTFRYSQNYLHVKQFKPRTTYGYNRISIINRKTRLYAFDLFGLGPGEIAVVFAAIFLFYGPENIQKNFKRGSRNNDEPDKNFKDSIFARPWINENKDRIDDMVKQATDMRRKLAWKRINLLIEQEDPLIISKLAQLDDGKLVDIKNRK